MCWQKPLQGVIYSMFVFDFIAIFRQKADNLRLTRSRIADEGK